MVGGGMYNNNASSPVLSNVAFINNQAQERGGGLFFYQGSPVLTGITFTDNYAGLKGGGLFNGNSNLFLRRAVFSGNQSGESGGAIYNFSSPAQISEVTFTNNTAVLFGGGLYNNLSNPNLTSITFSGNSSSSGGAVYNAENSHPLIVSITFVDNVAGQAGGALFNSYSTADITNSIIWGNIPDAISGSQSLVTYSIIQGGFAGTGNLDVDPDFVPPDGSDPFISIYPLQPGSPAIDSGNPDPLTCPLTDQRGFPRPIDGDGDGVAICDMGSYEYGFQYSIYLPITFK